MCSLPDSLSSDPFDRLPSDILVLVYEQLGLHDLSSLGRTSSANRELHGSLSLPTYLSQHYPLHRQLSLSPALTSTSTNSSAHRVPLWTVASVTEHLYLASRRVTRRQFVARPLPLPASGSKVKRVAALRPLLAVGSSRVVCAGVGGKRSSLVVYELGERAEDQGRGEKIVNEGWEVGFGSGVGERQASEERVTPPAGPSVDGDETPPTRTGTGGLLSGDLTGLDFFSLEEDDAHDEETVLLLSFANGVVQTVRLPSPPPSSPAPDTSTDAPVKSTGSRRRKGAKPVPSQPSRQLPLLTLVHTYSHPPSPIQSLSRSPTHPATFLTTSYSSLLTLHSLLPVPTTLSLPSTQTPWSSLLLPSSSMLIGLTTSLLHYPSVSPTHNPRSLLSSTNNSATYALHSHPLNPSLVLSAHSHPLACVLMHDLRKKESEVGRYEDPWTEEGWYSVGMSEDGKTVLGGTGGGGRIGVWDVRAGKGGGWTAFAPKGEAEGKVGEVGGLVWKGAGRVWGVTPSSPFLLDFSPTSNLSTLYPPLPKSPASPAASTSTFARHDAGIVSWYAHAGSSVRPGTSQAFI